MRSSVSRRAHEYRAGHEHEKDFLGTLTFGRLKLADRIRTYFNIGSVCYPEPTMLANIHRNQRRILHAKFDSPN